MRVTLRPVQELYQKHHRWASIGFFLLGFAFDAFMLRRIDEPAVLIQQAAYILVSAALIGLELYETRHEVKPPAWLGRAWGYREALLHFLLGTLLNSYTIFYFKSASAFTALAFVVVLVAILIANEFSKFGGFQTRFHVTLLSLCLISYLVALLPILLGYIGMGPFLGAVAGSFALFYGYRKAVGFFIDRAAPPPSAAHPQAVPAGLRQQLVVPFVAVQALFAVLYFARIIPPVPLSVTYVGIYHDARKQAGEYLLTRTRPGWKFWQHGDQSFLARPGDQIHCFVQIFSPARFRENLQVRWFFYDERRGWEPSDAIPLAVVGGREEGFRGVTKKTNYQPGRWRIQIETADGREIGRIGFTVVRDEGLDPPTLTIETR